MVIFRRDLSCCERTWSSSLLLSLLQITSDAPASSVLFFTLLLGPFLSCQAASSSSSLIRPQPRQCMGASSICLSVRAPGPAPLPKSIPWPLGLSSSCQTDQLKALFSQIHKMTLFRRGGRPFCPPPACSQPFPVLRHSPYYGTARGLSGRGGVFIQPLRGTPPQTSRQLLQPQLPFIQEGLLPSRGSHAAYVLLSSHWGRGWADSSGASDGSWSTAGEWVPLETARA